MKVGISVPALGDPYTVDQKSKKKFHFTFMRWKDFPLLILAAGILLTIGIWDFSNRERTERILDNTKNQADQIRLLLTNHIESYFTFMPRVASMITGKEEILPEAAQKYLTSTLDGYQAISAIQVIDASKGKAIWTQAASDFEKKYFERFFENQVSPSNEWKATIQEALKRNAVVISTPFSILMRAEDKEPKSYVYALFPIRDLDGEPSGYLLQYLNIDLILSKFFKEQSLIFYHYLISFQWKVLYSDLKYWREVSAQRPFKVTRQITVADKTWWLNIWPKEEFLAGGIQSELTGILLLTMGILFSISAALFAWSLVTRSETMERLVQVRTHELEEVNRALKDKNEELESFIYVLSHDLKAPLVSMTGFLSLLGPARSKLADEERICIDRIQANTTRMHEMVQSLLELSRVGRVKEIPEDVDTRKVVQDILNEMQPIIEKKNIRIMVNGNFPVIRAPRSRFIQVFSNLIGNAVKYIGGAKSPFIEIGVGVDSNGYHQFYVRDNGIGIPKEYQDKIFWVFERGPHASQNEEGTGIGLSIVKKIVEGGGGRIWVESEEGKGSQFFFTVPRQKQ